MDAEDGAPAQKEEEAVATAPVGASEAAEEAPPPEPAVPVAAERSPAQIAVPATPEKQESEAATAAAALQEAAQHANDAARKANEHEEESQAALEPQKDCSTMTQAEEPATTLPSGLEAPKEKQSDAVPVSGAEKVEPAGSSCPARPHHRVSQHRSQLPYQRRQNQRLRPRAQPKQNPRRKGKKLK